MRRFSLSALALLLALAASAISASARQQGAKPFTIEELLVVRRVGDPQLSPDGRQVAFTITDTDKAASRRTTQIYLVPASGGEVRQLTKEAQSSASPRWSPDGTRLAFTRGGQIMVMDVAAGAVRQVTNISTEADGPVWSPDGKWIAFVSSVYPECADDECNKRRAQQVSESKVKAKVIDRLLFRHWNAWQDGKRSHVFVAPSAGGAPARDLTPGDFDAPPFSLGGPPDYAFSADSTELAFARNTDKVEATSTNGDIFVAPVAGGEARRITGANKANDLSPQYSPDGRYIAYRAQVKPGFESDRWRLMLYDRRSNQSRSVTESFDALVEGFTFTRDSRHVYFASPERGQQHVYRLTLAGGKIEKVVAGGTNDDVQVSADGRTLVFTRHSLSRPLEIFRADADGKNVVQITRTNDAMLANYFLPEAEEMTWEGAEGARVHGFYMKPINFDASKKYPLVVLIHGGPQGAWNNAWSYRWNPQLFASQGYAVFLPNPRGSTGYGQRFTDEISGDWAGKVFVDLKNGVAHVLSTQGYIDRERVGAAGGSYGGYMVNWILGHNDDPRFRFKALVSHAGVFNLTSMAGVTEELWFTNWEFGGMPWEKPEVYEKWSPHLHVKNFKTPTLVIHGELDFRVPVGEGFQLFTALQMMGVESKLLYYPDEGHWVLKPQNSELWYKTVLQWFDRHLKGAAA